MSAAYEMIPKRRVARPTEEPDDDTLKVIVNSSVSPEYAVLDEFLKDWTP